MELYQKIYVKPTFLETEHGQIPCEVCHGGDPRDADWQTAHKTVVRDPTAVNADRACCDCHEDVVAEAVHSLHYTLSPFRKAIAGRMGYHHVDFHNQVDRAMDNHCRACHASCGQCHVSRPDYVGGGFLDRHHFKKTPPMDITCASCHGGRVYGEYTGANEKYIADVHYESGDMTCMDCHKAAELHADGRGVKTRFDLPQRPRCDKCHEDAISAESTIPSHQIHRDKVACQVCHGQANKNCFVCHVGADRKGLPYFKCKNTTFLFKVGRNPYKSEDRPFEWVVLRHSPTDPGLFEYYVPGALDNFDVIPTWKLDTPHNIRRITPQNQACNNCHGNISIFLAKDDVSTGELKANTGVWVCEESIPKPVKTNSIKVKEVP